MLRLIKYICGKFSESNKEIKNFVFVLNVLLQSAKIILDKQFYLGKTKFS